MSRRGIEIFDRILDLAIKVAEGVIDPFDVDVGRFIDMISMGDDLVLDYDYLVKDIRALNGLILILEAQSKALKKKGMGLYIDRALIKLKLYKMGIDELADVFVSAWRPVIEVESIDIDSIEEALFYFNSLKDLESRKFKFEYLKDISQYEFEPRYFIIPKDIRKRMFSLFEEFKAISQGEFIDYDYFIHFDDDPVERAYILSFLISDGWIDVKVDRLEEKIYIRPREMKVALNNPSSLSVVVRREKR